MEPRGMTVQAPLAQTLWTQGYRPNPASPAGLLGPGVLAMDFGSVTAPLPQAYADYLQANEIETCF